MVKTIGNSTQIENMKKCNCLWCLCFCVLLVFENMVWKTVWQKFLQHLPLFLIVFSVVNCWITYVLMNWWVDEWMNEWNENEWGTTQGTQTEKLTKTKQFLKVGFCDEFSSTLASVGLGFMKVLSTGVSLAVVDGIGRRKALLGGITFMALSVLSLAIFAFYQVRHSFE